MSDNWQLLKLYAWVVGLAVFGGAVSHFQRLNSTSTAFRWGVFFAEIATSGFAGLLTYWLCQAAAMNAPITAMLVGIGGHMGTRSIARLESVYNRIFGEKP